MYNGFLALDKIKIKIRNIQKYAFLTVLIILCSILTDNVNFYLLLNNIIAISMILAFIYVYIIRGKFVGKGFVARFKVIYLILIMILAINVTEITPLKLITSIILISISDIHIIRLFLSLFLTTSPTFIMQYSKVACML